MTLQNVGYYHSFSNGDGESGHKPVEKERVNHPRGNTDSI